MNVLTAEIIRDACARGYAWYDMNPSGGHEGVEEFGRRWGTIELPCPYVATEPLAARAVGALARLARTR